MLLRNISFSKPSRSFFCAVLCTLSLRRDKLNSRILSVDICCSPPSPAAIAKDAGVAVSEHELFADATGKRGEMETVNGETYDLGTYIGMMKHNVNAIVEGLK